MSVQLPNNNSTIQKRRPLGELKNSRINTQKYDFSSFRRSVAVNIAKESAKLNDNTVPKSFRNDENPFTNKENDRSSKDIKSTEFSGIKAKDETGQNKRRPLNNVKNIVNNNRSLAGTKSSSLRNDAIKIEQKILNEDSSDKLKAQEKNHSSLKSSKVVPANNDDVSAKSEFSIFEEKIDSFKKIGENFLIQQEKNSFDDDDPIEFCPITDDGPDTYDDIWPLNKRMCEINPRFFENIFCPYRSAASPNVTVPDLLDEIPTVEPPDFDELMKQIDSELEKYRIS